MSFLDYNGIVLPLVNIVSSIIPSVKGMGNLSPNKCWGEVYFLLCLAGSPFYIRFSGGLRRLHTLHGLKRKNHSDSGYSLRHCK